MDLFYGVVQISSSLFMLSSAILIVFSVAILLLNIHLPWSIASRGLVLAARARAGGGALAVAAGAGGAGAVNE